MIRTDMWKKDSQLGEKWENKNLKFKKLLKRIFVEILVCIFVILLLYILFRPRTCCVGWRSRDVVRREDLTEVWTAILKYKDTTWMRPDFDKAKKWTIVHNVPVLNKVWMTYIPSDPRINNKNYWLWDITASWEYLYLITKKNWIDDAWFVLMASTEWEGISNRVVCKDGSWLEKWYITNDTDLEDIVTCETHTKWDYCLSNSNACTYTDSEELRYILIH